MASDTPQGSRHDDSKDDNSAVINTRASSKRRRADTAGNATKGASKDLGLASLQEEKSNTPTVKFKVERVRCIVYFQRVNCDWEEKIGGEELISELTADELRAVAEDLIQEADRLDGDKLLQSLLDSSHEAKRFTIQNKEGT